MANPRKKAPEDSPEGALVLLLVREAVSLNSRACLASPVHTRALALWYSAAGHHAYKEGEVSESAIVTMQRVASEALGVPRPERAPWEMTRAEYSAATALAYMSGTEGRREVVAAWKDLAEWARGQGATRGLDSIAAGVEAGLCHRLEVERALFVRRSVPDHVLAEYPDLVKQGPPGVLHAVLPPGFVAEFERVCASHLASCEGTGPAPTIAQMEERFVALRILAAGMRGLGPQWWLAEAQLEVQIDDLAQGLRTRRELGS